jgi:hypothetical protein
VSRSINFYRSQQGGSPPGQVLLAGGSSIMPHMDTFFKEKLKVPVEYLNPFIHVPVGADLDQEAVGRDVHLLGEVTGLALRRSLTCPVEINLMPPDLVARKTLRRRQPFFVISAIGFVLIMLCWWVYFLRMKDMLRVRAATVEERVGGLNGQANRLNVVKAQGDVVRAQSADLTRLLALRTRWIEMLGAVHGCLLDGMWLKSVTPVVEGGQVVALDISGFGFLDILTNTAEATATEQLCNRLKGLGIFAAERTRITREPVVNAEDFAREFTIRAELKEPLRVADEGAAAAPGQN